MKVVALDTQVKAAAFMTIPGAVHTGLYDGGVNHDLIPFAKRQTFFSQYLN